MTSVETVPRERVVPAPDASRSVRWLLIASVGAALAATVGIGAWVLHASVVNHWLAVHTGTVNEPGPYYGFWSGFGSDLAEFGIIGAIGTGVYQIVRKYNCHEPGCRHVGTHPAAGGQFLLCYRHHPDFHGERPTSEVIARLHHEHTAQQAAVREKLSEIHQRVTDERPSSDRSAGARSATTMEPR